MDEDYLKAIFEESKKNYSFKDYDEFKGLVETDPEFRKNFYNDASSSIDLGKDVGEFETNLGLKKKDETVSSPAYPQNLEDPGNGQLANSPSQLPLASPSEEKPDSGINMYGFKWPDQQPIGDARLGDVQRADMTAQKSVEVEQKQKAENIQDEANNIKHQLRYSEKFGNFMDAETEEKEKSFFEQKGFSREAVDKAFAEEGEKRFKANAYQAGANMQEQDLEEIANNLKEQGFDDKKKGGQLDFIQAQSDALDLKINQEAVNSFTPDQLEVFKLNTELEGLYKKGRENPKTFSKEDAAKIAELRQQTKEIKNNQKLLYDPRTGELTDKKSPEAIRFNSATENLAKEYESTFKDKLKELRDEKYYNLRYAQSIYDDKQKSYLQPFGTATDSQKSMAQKAKAQFLRSKMEFDAANRALLLNEDPAGLNKGFLTEAGQETKSALLENLPIAKNLFPDGITNMNDRDYIDTYQKVITEGAAKETGENKKLEITSQQEERFKRKFSERLGEGLGGAIAVLPEFIVYGALIGQGAGAIGLGRVISKLKSAPEITKRTAAFLMEAGLEELKFQAVGSEPGAGAGFAAAGRLIPKFTQKGPIGAALKPFIDGLLQGGVGMAAGMGGAAAIESAVKSISGTKEWKDYMAEKYGDENGNVTISSATQATLIDAAIGTLFGLAGAASKKGSFTIDPDKLETAATELSSKGYAREAQDLNEKAAIFRGFRPPPDGGGGKPGKATKVEDAETEDFGKINLDDYEFIVDGKRMSKSEFVSKFNSDKKFVEGVGSGEIPVQINKEGIKVDEKTVVNLIENYVKKPKPGKTTVVEDAEIVNETTTEEKKTATGKPRTPSKKETVGGPVVPDQTTTPVKPRIEVIVTNEGNTVIIDGGKKQTVKNINMDADGNIISVDLVGKDGETKIEDVDDAANIAVGVQIKKLEASGASVSKLSEAVAVTPELQKTPDDWDEGAIEIAGIFNDTKIDTNVQAAIDGLEQGFIMADDIEYGINWATTAIDAIDKIETSNIKVKQEHLDLLHGFLNELYDEKGKLENKGTAITPQTAGESKIPDENKPEPKREGAKADKEIKFILGDKHKDFVAAIENAVEKEIPADKVIKQLDFDEVLEGLDEGERNKVLEYVDAFLKPEDKPIENVTPPGEEGGQKPIDNGKDDQEGRQGDKDLLKPDGGKPEGPVSPLGEHPVAGSKEVGQYRPGAKDKIISEGNETQINFVDGDKHNAIYVVAPINEVLPSHHPTAFSKSKEYPVDKDGNTTNDRNYETDKKAQGTVSRYSNKPDPQALLDASSYTMTGPPIITADLFVVGGNNRQMVLMNMSPEAYQEYYNEMQAKSKMMGVTLPQFDDKNRVGVYRKDVDAKQYSKANSKKYNQEPGKEKDENDEAIGFGASLAENPRALELLYEEVGKHDTFSSLFASLSSTKFIRNLLLDNKVLDEKDLNKFFDKDGAFSAQGKIRLRNGLFSSLFDEDILRLWDVPGVTEFVNKIETSLPIIANNFKLGDEFSLKEEIQDAIKLQQQFHKWKQSAKVEGKKEPTIIDYIRNMPLFGKPTIDAFRTWYLIDKSSAKKNHFKDALKSYNNSATDKGNAMFQEDAPKTKKDFLSLLRKYLSDDDNRIIEIALFDQEPPGPDAGGVGPNRGGISKKEPPRQNEGGQIQGDGTADGGGIQEKRDGQAGGIDDLFDQLEEPREDYATIRQNQPYSGGNPKYRQYHHNGNTFTFADFPGKAYAVPVEIKPDKTYRLVSHDLFDIASELHGQKIGPAYPGQEKFVKNRIAELEKKFNEQNAKEKTIFSKKKKIPISSYFHPKKGEAISRPDNGGGVELSMRSAGAVQEPEGEYKSVADKIVAHFINNGKFKFTEIIDAAFEKLGPVKLATNFEKLKTAYKNFYIDATDAVSEKMDTVKALKEFDIENYLKARVGKGPEIKPIDFFPPPAPIDEIIEESPDQNGNIDPPPPPPDLKPDVGEDIQDPTETALKTAYKDFADWFRDRYPEYKFYFDVKMGEDGPYISIANGDPLVKYNDWISDKDLQKDWRDKKVKINTRPPMVVVDAGDIPVPFEHVKPGQYNIGEDQALAVNLIMDRFYGGSPVVKKGYRFPELTERASEEEAIDLADYLNRRFGFTKYSGRAYRGLEWSTIWHNLEKDLSQWSSKLPESFFSEMSYSGEKLPGKKAFLLADGTGTGKTRTALVTALESAKTSGLPSIIITQNAAIVGGFKNEAKELNFTPEQINSIEIGTYDGLKSGAVGKKGKYGLVIFDEAHRMKNMSSGYAGAGQDIEDRAAHIVYATATPMDKPTSAAYFMAKIAEESEDAIAAKIGYRIERTTKKDGTISRKAVLNKGATWGRAGVAVIKLRDGFIKDGAMIRREFPFFGSIHEVNIPLTATQLEEYNRMKEEFEAAKISGQVASGHFSRWAEWQKFNYTMSEAMKALNDGKRIVIFAGSVEPSLIKKTGQLIPGFLTEAAKYFESKGIQVAKVFGTRDKKEQADLFQNDKVKVVLATPQSGGTGINLDDTFGDKPREVFIVTAPYNGNDMDQAIGRTSRRNTKSPSLDRVLYAPQVDAEANRRGIVRRKMTILRNIQAGIDPDQADIMNWDDLNEDNNELGGEEGQDLSFEIPDNLYAPHKQRSMEDFPANPVPAGVPFKVSKEVVKLLNEIGVPVAENYLTSRQLGVYKLRSKNIRLRAEFDVFVATHEAAHYISIENKIGQQIRDTADKQIIKRLTDIYLEFYPTANKSANLFTKVEEGIAVLLENYFYNPSYIKKQYPDLIDEFINPSGKYYNQKITMLLEGMTKIHENWTALTPMERIGARVRTGREILETKRGDGFTLSQRFSNEVVNSNEPIAILDKISGTSWYENTFDLKGNRADKSVEAKYISWHNRAAIINSNINGIGLIPTKDGKNFEPTMVNFKQLEDVLKKNPKDRMDFLNYLIARRTTGDYNDMVDLKSQIVNLEFLLQQEQNKFTPNDILIDAYKDQIKEKEASVQKIEDILNNNNFNVQESVAITQDNDARFEKAAKIHDALVENLRLWMYRSGLITHDAYEKFKEKESYARFSRFIHDEYIESGITSLAGGKSESKIRSTMHYGGSQKDIIDPIYGLMVSFSEVIKKALINRMKQAMVLLTYDNPEVARLVEWVPTIVEKGPKGSISFKNSKDPKQMGVLFNGKMTFYKLAPELQRWTDELPRPVMDWATMMFVNIPVRIFTAGTTSMYPMFAVGNTFLDQFTSFNNSTTGFKPFFSSIKESPDIAKTFVNYLKQQSAFRATYKMFTGKDLPELTIADVTMFQKYMALGGKKNTKFNMYDLSPEDMVALQLGRQKGMKKFLTFVDNYIISVAEMPVNMTEIMTRFTEFSRAKKMGLSDDVAMQRAASVSVSFYALGRWGGKEGAGRFVMRMIPYMSAQIQGLANLVSATKRNSPKIAATLAAGMATALGLALLSYEIMDEEDKEFLSNIPLEELGKYLWIPKAAWGGKGLMPIRIPDIFGQAMGLTYMYVAQMYGYDRVTFNKAVDMTMSGLPNVLQVNKPELIPWAITPQFLKPALAVSANKRTYPEIAPIVPEYMHKYLPEDQYTAYSSKLGKEIGRQMGWSPLLVDYFINAQFGRTWAWITGGRNSNNPLDKQAKDFIKRGRNINTFYNMKEYVDQQYSSMDKSLKDAPAQTQAKLIEAYVIYDKANTILSLIRKIHDEGNTLPNDLLEAEFHLLNKLEETHNPIELSDDIQKLWDKTQSVAEQYKIEHKFSVMMPEVDILKKQINRGVLETSEKNPVRNQK